MAVPLPRALGAELLGTYALVFFGPGAVVVQAQTGALGHAGVALVFGLTVTVVILAAFGIWRDQRMTKGSSILASFSAWASPSHLKALVVYSADCRPFLRLNCGYLPRLAKKLEKAVCK